MRKFYDVHDDSVFYDHIRKLGLLAEVIIAARNLETYYTHFGLMEPLKAFRNTKPQRNRNNLKR